MYKRIRKVLLTFLAVASAMQIKLVDANCTNWSLFSQAETIRCESINAECCGWLLETSCCTRKEKANTEDFRNIVCRIIVFVIVIGIILIFIAFLIGWIYSCYLIAKQIQETPEEDDETRTETNGQSLVSSFFTRYINTISVANQQPPSDHRPEVFSLPIHDKPPSYNSLFKPTVHPNGPAANRAASNQSLTSSVYSSYQTAPEQQTGRRPNSHIVSMSASNPGYVVDDLPSYDSVKALS